MLRMFIAQEAITCKILHTFVSGLNAKWHPTIRFIWIRGVFTLHIETGVL